MLKITGSMIVSWEIGTDEESLVLFGHHNPKTKQLDVDNAITGAKAKEFVTLLTDYGKYKAK